MVVVVANHIPPAVRGRMKLWFIEPRANVFVSGVRDSVADEVVKYLYENCPAESGILILQRTRTAPGYKVVSLGKVNRRVELISGLQLFIEN